MEQWSILSNVINHVQNNRKPINYYKLDVKALESKKHKRIYEKLEENDRQDIDISFGDTPKNIIGKIYRYILRRWIRNSMQ